MDTHVLNEAAAQDARGTSGDDRSLLETILTVSAQIVVSPGQHRELYPHAAKLNAAIGPRRSFLPTMSPLFGQLEEHGKFLRPVDSKIRPLDQDAIDSLFKGRGHRNIMDDVHLFEAASTYDHIVITRDSNIIDRRDPIAKKLKIRTYSPDELLHP